MHASVVVSLLCLWAGLCIAVPVWGHRVSRQGRIAVPLLALGAIWYGAALPFEPHGSPFAFAALLSFPLGWIGHWLYPFPGSNTPAFALVRIAGALSAATNFYLLAWVMIATRRWPGGISLRLRAQRLGGIIAVLSGCASVCQVQTDGRVGGCPDALHAGEMPVAKADPEKTLKQSDEARHWNDPATAKDLKNLAIAYYRVGRLKEAITLLEEAIASYHTFPPNRGELESVRALGKAYHTAGDLPEALRLLNRALIWQKQEYGEDHRDTLNTMQNLADDLFDAGRNDEALALLETTRRLQQTKLGPEDPDTLATISHLAEAYRTAGRNAEALAMLEQTLQLQKASEETNRDNMLLTMNNLALVYQSIGRHSEALTLLERTLPALQKARWLGHPDTIKTMNNLASARLQAGQTNQALSLLEKGAVLAREKLGVQHFLTPVTLTNLAHTFHSVGNFAKAEPILLEVVGILEDNDQVPVQEKRRGLEHLQKFYLEWAVAAPGTRKTQEAFKWSKRLAEFDHAQEQNK